MVIVFHAQFPYTQQLETIWIVNDSMKSSSLGLVGMYIDLFVMQTLFFIPGYFVPISLQRKSSMSFLVSKAKRIMLPWLFGVLVLIPLYKVLYLYSRGMPQEEWFSYFHWFERSGGNPYLFSDNLSQSWLWFLPILFLFQLAYAGLSKLKGLSSVNLSIKSGVMAIFIIGVVSSTVISTLGGTGWYDSLLFHFQNERLLIYFSVFLLGALCHNKNVFQTNKRNKKLYIWANVIMPISLSLYTVVALNMFFNLIDPGRGFFFISQLWDLTFYYGLQLISMFAFIYILIDFFRFKLNRIGTLAQTLNQNSYYVYLIHMIVSGGVATLLLKTSIPVAIKYIVLAILTFTISNILVSIYRSIKDRVITNYINNPNN